MILNFRKFENAGGSLELLANRFTDHPGMAGNRVRPIIVVKMGSIFTANPIARQNEGRWHRLLAWITGLLLVILKLPGFIDQNCWDKANRLANENEVKIFGSKISPLNKTLFFRGLYILLLKQQTKIGKMELSLPRGIT